MPNRVLIVDDDELVVRVFKRVLANTHVVLLPVPEKLSSQSLLEVSWELLILDAHLGSNSGILLLEEMKALAPEKLQRIVVISGDSSFEKRVRDIGSRFLAKPIDFDRLRSTIDEVLRIKD
jgi:DNA-binding NtrC family response regulator